MRKINCPFHTDKTASLALYEDHAHCYGCGWHGPLSALPEDKVKKDYAGTFGAIFPKSRENMPQTMDRIAALPRKVIRGLELPYDSKGYYIVYPDVSYYVRRNWDGDAASKYHNPAGHPKQLLKLGSAGAELVVVEGQLNALSAAGLGHIVSPGSAQDLLSEKLFNYCLQFSRIAVIVDKDPAGVIAGLKLKDKLITAGKRCIIYPMPRDLNDILVQDGKEAVEEEVKRAVAML